MGFFFLHGQIIFRHALLQNMCGRLKLNEMHENQIKSISTSFAANICQIERKESLQKLTALCSY